MLYVPTVEVSKLVIHTDPTEDSFFGFRSEYSVYNQTEPKAKICFGLLKPSPIPKNFVSICCKIEFL